MRYVLLAGLVALACRGERADTHAADPRSTQAVSVGPAEAAARFRDSHRERAAGITDDELIAFTRWRREYAELLGRHLAELNAIASPDPSKPLDQALEEARLAAEEETARHRPAMQALLERQPLEGAKAELATEAMGGLFHTKQTPTGARIVVARDAERIGAARRRFGNAAVDDVLARESLILAELECVGDAVYANVWQTSRIARIDARTGDVTAWIEVAGLLTEAEARGADVLNGIAHLPSSGRFVLTGKLWPRAFEVEFVATR